MKKITETTDYHASLQASRYYHVYNRTNNKEILFQTDIDRQEFLKRMTTYIFPYADIFTYCLMGNHFHLLIRVKSVEEIEGIIKKIPLSKRTVAQKAFFEIEEQKTVEKVLESQFHRYFTAYSMYFNIRHRRSGNLFTRRFKRIEVDNELYLLHLVYYIHSNPVKEDFRNYRWSSYRTFFSDNPTKLAKVEVLRWFGGIENFLDFHTRDIVMDDKFEKYLLE